MKVIEYILKKGGYIMDKAFWDDVIQTLREENGHKRELLLPPTVDGDSPGPIQPTAQAAPLIGRDSPRPVVSRPADHAEKLMPIGFGRES